MFKSRKFFIWLISLAVVLIIYLLYNRISRTPQIDIDTGAESAGAVADSNIGQFGSEIGMIGDVGVEAVQKARYTHLNKDKKVDREFGFEKLLHEVGDEWEIEKPYMNIFRRNFKFYITSDRGKVQVETAAGRTSPKDATLTGNVVIRILPENTSDIKESFVYLDDVIFISERSQFSTDGPVRFVSENARMLGTGLEIVYNDESDRLEFLRIVHLESLRLKTSSKASLFSSSQADVGSSVSQANVGSSVGTASQAQSEPPAEPAGQRYRAVFSKNVVIDGPEQLIFADEVFINNIQERKGTGNQGIRKSGNQGRNHESPVTSYEPQTTNHESQFADIVVTCDNGILVTPMDSVVSYKDSAELKPQAAVPEDKKPGDFNDTDGRPVFLAQRIDYYVLTGNTIASGRSELTFDVNDVGGAGNKEAAVPVKIIAHKKAEFLPALNQVIFEGDTLCTMLREDPNIQQKYTLSAPKLTVSLSRDKASQADIEHLTADGGVVKLATVKKAQGKLLGGIELKCLRFDYDPGQQLFLAAGPPGIIKVDNSKIAVPKEKLGRFSLRKRCYAVVRDFETLKYSLEANQIIADAGRGAILIDYFPIVQGRTGQQVKATAGHIEAGLIETASGQNELSSLSATDGITYEDEDKQFVGGEMFYDAGKSIITAWGDDSQHCLYNGVLVDGIRFDLKTGKVKVGKIIGGVLQRKR